MLKKINYTILGVSIIVSMLICILYMLILKNTYTTFILVMIMSIPIYFIIEKTDINEDKNYNILNSKKLKNKFNILSAVNSLIISTIIIIIYAIMLSNIYLTYLLIILMSIPTYVIVKKYFEKKNIIKNNENMEIEKEE